MVALPTSRSALHQGFATGTGGMPAESSPVDTVPLTGPALRAGGADPAGRVCQNVAQCRGVLFLQICPLASMEHSTLVSPGARYLGPLYVDFDVGSMESTGAHEPGKSAV